ncbi:hypothetical protein SELMODRAFT_421648 [Selaginella moellendorffii]|uniref:Uncharacterized protein n=1 Tax=Selaginella moellendorffii TaxID=88036 RepID=D8SFX6_SELML|nr:hypothetical protein SELMODRAFT_421648 [Selaginella moellendorffii]
MARTEQERSGCVTGLWSLFRPKKAHKGDNKVHPEAMDAAASKLKPIKPIKPEQEKEDEEENQEKKAEQLKEEKKAEQVNEEEKEADQMKPMKLEEEEEKEAEKQLKEEEQEKKAEQLSEEEQEKEAHETKELRREVKQEQGHKEQPQLEREEKNQPNQPIKPIKPIKQEQEQEEEQRMKPMKQQLEQEEEQMIKPIKQQLEQEEEQMIKPIKQPLEREDDQEKMKQQENDKPKQEEQRPKPILLPAGGRRPGSRPKMVRFSSSAEDILPDGTRRRSETHLSDGRGGYVEFAYLEALHKLYEELNGKSSDRERIKRARKMMRLQKMLDRIPSERKPWKKLQSGEVVFVKEAKELYDRVGRDFVAEFKRRQRAEVNDECLFCRNHDGEKMIGRAGANSKTTRPWVYLRREHEQTVLSMSKKREMKLAPSSRSWLQGLAEKSITLQASKQASDQRPHSSKSREDQWIKFDYTLQCLEQGGIYLISFPVDRDETGDTAAECSYSCSDESISKELSVRLLQGKSNPKVGVGKLGAVAKYPSKSSTTVAVSEDGGRDGESKVVVDEAPGRAVGWKCSRVHQTSASNPPPYSSKSREDQWIKLGYTLQCLEQGRIYLIGFPVDGDDSGAPAALKLLVTGVSDGCGDYKTDYARRSLSSGGMREVFGQEFLKEKPQGIMADGVESAARADGEDHGTRGAGGESDVPDAQQSFGRGALKDEEDKPRRTDVRAHGAPRSRGLTDQMDATCDKKEHLASQEAVFLHASAQASQHDQGLKWRKHSLTARGSKHVEETRMEVQEVTSSRESNTEQRCKPRDILPRLQSFGDILINREIADNFVKIWASQAELAETVAEIGAVSQPSGEESIKRWRAWMIEDDDGKMISNSKKAIQRFNGHLYNREMWTEEEASCSDTQIVMVAPLVSATNPMSDCQLGPDHRRLRKIKPASEIIRIEQVGMENCKMILKLGEKGSRLKQLRLSSLKTKNFLNQAGAAASKRKVEAAKEHCKKDDLMFKFIMFESLKGPRSDFDLSNKMIPRAR